jgi:hypothetical protein
VTHSIKEEMYNKALRLKRVNAALAGLPLLSISLVKAAAVDNLVVVTCASWDYYDFLLNWASHLRKIGVTNFLVGAFPSCAWGLEPYDAAENPGPEAGVPGSPPVRARELPSRTGLYPSANVKHFGFPTCPTLRKSERKASRVQS